MTPEPSAWRALADPTRRRLIELLRDGPRTTGDLCRAFSTSRFAVMKHLRVLERTGLIAVTRQGRTRWNTLLPEKLRETGARWAEARPARSAAAEPTAAAASPPQPGAIDEFASAEIFADAPAWKVFDALTVSVAAWWGPPHVRAADATNLVLEPQPGGRFFEEWGHRQGALRGTVTAIRQDQRLELTGPLSDGSDECRLCFQLEPREGGTLVTVTTWRFPVGAVDDLFRVRLKAFVERGVRSGIAR